MKSVPSQDPDKTRNVTTTLASVASNTFIKKNDSLGEIKENQDLNSMIKNQQKLDLVG